MKPLSNIIGKEVKEMLTLATIVPVVIMAVLFASLGGAIGGAQHEAAKAPKIALIDQDHTLYSQISVDWISKNTEVVYNGTDVDEGLKSVTSVGGSALLVILPGFASNLTANASGTIQVYWIMYGAGAMDAVSSAVVDNIISGVNRQLSTAMIQNHMTDNATVILNPTVKSETTYFKGKTMEGVSPVTISSVLSSQSFLVPLVVMMVILMTGGTVIASMGMEKENKTLETLLTMPVKRRDIVLGKLAGAALVGLIMAVVYMAGMGYYMSSLQSQGSLDLARYGLILNPLDYALVGLSLFLAVLSALSLCMLLGAFARDYKSAQSLTMPITFLAMVPFFVMMLKDFNTLPAFAQVGLFLIPFSHPMMAMNNLMFDDYGLVLAGIAYEALFAGLAMGLAVWMFKKDMLITGRKKKEKRAGLRWKPGRKQA